MIWWKSNPDLFEKFKHQLSEFSDLEITIENDKVSLSSIWSVYGSKRLIKKYWIKIVIPDDYPNTVPKVFEIGDDLPKISDRHFNGDKSACLFVEPARWEYWPLGAGIDTFLKGPVKEFFFSQAYYDLTGKWPFGQWSHGDKGIIEYFLNRLKLKNFLYLKNFIHFLEYEKPARQWRCPCNSGKRFKQCHWDMFAQLRDILPNDQWMVLNRLC